MFVYEVFNVRTTLNTSHIYCLWENIERQEKILLIEMWLDQF